MSDIPEALAAFTEEEIEILKAFAAPEVAKRAWKRAHPDDPRGSLVSGASVAAYKPPEPRPAAPPAPAPRRVMGYREGDAGSQVFLPVYVDD